MPRAVCLYCSLRSRQTRKYSSSRYAHTSRRVRKDQPRVAWMRVRAGAASMTSPAMSVIASWPETRFVAATFMNALSCPRLGLLGVDASHQPRGARTPNGRDQSARVARKQRARALKGRAPAVSFELAPPIFNEPLAVMPAVPYFAGRIGGAMLRRSPGICPLATRHSHRLCQHEPVIHRHAGFVLTVFEHEAIVAANREPTADAQEQVVVLGRPQ